MKRLHTNIYTAFLLQLGASLLLLNLTRYIFYFMNASYFPSIDFQQWIEISSGGFKFDLAAVLYTNSLFIVLQILPITLRHHKIYIRISGVIYLITNTLMITASVIDMVYFRFTLRRSTWMIFKEFSNEKNIGIILLKSLAHYWYLIPIFIGLTTLLFFFYRKISRSITKPSQTKYNHAGNIAMMIAIPIFFVGGVRGDFKYTTRPITMSNAGEYVKDPAMIHLVLNTPFCILRTMQQQFYDRNDFFDEKNVATHFNPVQIVSSDTSFKYDNVVIIILESFGRESIGFYNKQLVNVTYKGYTPFLDSLLGEGRTRLHSFANGRKSIDAIPSVLISIPAGEIPFILTPYVSNKTKSLPAILKEKGYTTAFFHGAPNGSMGFKALMNLIGVDHYYGKDEYGNDKDFDGTWGIWDEPFFQFSADKINQLKEPFISTIFSVSSHEPFVVPSKYRNKFPKGDHPLRETIGYTDMALRNFFAKAQQMSWFKKTLFVITGDHASISYLPEYKTSWGNMAVPVLFYHPGDISLKKVEDKLVQQIDIMPSVLSYLHYRKPFIAFGKNIFDSSTSNTVMNYYNGFELFKNDYVLQLNGDKPYSMYNYKTDPRLKNNLLNTMKARQDSMENIIKAFIQQYHNRLINDSLTIK